MKVVSYRNSTSNHNWELIIWKNRLLYLIEILHQTTTRFCILFPVYRCILSKFYIKPQLARVASYSAIRCILSKFYIKPQQRPPSVEISASCILSKFYIKPQPQTRSRRQHGSCILSKFYIKPQPAAGIDSRVEGCILSKFYIKPQLTFALFFQFIVVSYRNSTSNHNSDGSGCSSKTVVSYRNSTSNHNNCLYNEIRSALYLIEILHQTTTRRKTRL